jgi:hypothetical protein
VFELDHEIDDVFFILTNENDYILHFSQNCVHYLDFHDSLMNKDVKLDELIEGLDSTSDDLFNPDVGQQVILNLDKVLLHHNEEDIDTKKIKL